MKDDLISRQDAIELVRDVCDAIMSDCDSYYDTEIGDEVYKDILEVDAILKCNKEILIALKNMPSAQPDKTVIDKCLFKINSHISPHTSTTAVIEIKYYMQELYEEIYGKGAKPKWMI